MKGKYNDHLYFIFRVLVGLFFLMHGGQKLFGWFGGLGGNPAELISLMGLAGVIEFFGGLAILLGIFVRLAAFIAAAEMVVALFMAHFPQGYVLIKNGGEPAALFFASFLVLFAYGAGKWSLGRALFRKEVL